MSTGIGKHKYSEIGSHVIEPLAICPYCGFRECHADWVSVYQWPFEVQCGPFHCDSCGASEASYLDTRELTAREVETGWYEPGTPASEHANTHNGVIVGHVTAKDLYRRGMLDEKPTVTLEDNEDWPF